MVRKIILSWITLAALFALAPVEPVAVEAQSGKQVWAYFFGWYTTDSWNDGRLLDRPQGRYSSFDDGRIGQQIAQAQSAGIDAFIHTWLGRGENNLTDIVLNKSLGQAAGRGFKIGVSVDMVGDGWLTTESAVVTEMQYLMNSVVRHPAYLTYNGKPVIYFWNQQRFSVDTWRRIREQVDPNRTTLWISEGVSTSYIPVFDGLYLFNNAWSSNPSGVAAQFSSLTYGAGGSLYTPTVMPGWNEDAVAISQNRDNPTAPQDRQSGLFLYNSWAGATSINPNVILIVSWNEYFENSHIEPSELHGSAALDVLRPLIASWKSGTSAPPPPAAPQAAAEEPSEGDGSPQAAAPAVSNAPGNPTGVQFTAGYNINVRRNPSTGAEVVGQLAFNASAEVVGRTGDGQWIQININGTSGWVAAGLGTLSDDLGALPVTG